MKTCDSCGIEHDKTNPQANVIEIYDDNLNPIGMLCHECYILQPYPDGPIKVGITLEQKAQSVNNRYTLKDLAENKDGGLACLSNSLAKHIWDVFSLGELSWQELVEELEYLYATAKYSMELEGP